jgi:hypothetical protein
MCIFSARRERFEHRGLYLVGNAFVAADDKNAGTEIVR